MIQIQCQCGETVNTYDHATEVVSCPKCHKDLLIPTGGKVRPTRNCLKTRELAE